MAEMTPELLALLEEFKALPKNDRKAIERQLTGRDKLFVKNAVSKLVETAMQNAEIHTEEEENAHIINYEAFPPWFAETVQNIINAPAGQHSALGVTQAVADILPICLTRNNDTLAIVGMNHNADGGKSFSTVLSRLRGDRD